uniref:Ig-like domain-containing protein n=1 Tax=Oreochromis niloticus TaxID=8128 RepID=A0A669EPT9_ORENI
MLEFPLQFPPHALTVELYEGDSFILPCEFPTFDLTDPSVMWSRSDLSPPTVHQRQPQGDELKDQNQRYSGRTSMKTDALETGDLSLTLTNLQLSDSATYTCSIKDKRTGGQRTVTNIQLQDYNLIHYCCSVKGQRSHSSLCFSTEWFPTWAKALLVLLVLLVLVLIVSGVLLFHFQQYFMSGECLLLHYP